MGSLLLVGGYQIFGVDLAEIKGNRYLKSGLSHYNQRQYIASIESFTKAISQKSRNRLARYYLASAYWRAGYPTYAKKKWRTYLDLFPKDVLARSRLQYIKQGELGRVHNPNIPYAVLKKHSLERADSPMEMFLTQDGDIWVTGLASQNVLKINRKGKVLARLTSGESAMGMPYGLAGTSEHLYVTDFRQDRVRVFDHEGDFRFAFGRSGAGQGRFHGPAGVVASRRGFVYVADSHNHRIQKFSTKGEFVLEMGGKGKGLGKFNQPVDVAYVSQSLPGIERDSLFVLEKGNLRLQQMDLYGNPLRQWRSGLLQEPVTLRRIGGRLYIGDLSAEGNGLVVFDLQQKKFFPGLKLLTDKAGKALADSRITSVGLDAMDHFYWLDHRGRRLWWLVRQDFKVSNLSLEVLAVDKSRFPVIGVWFRFLDKKGHAIQNVARGDITLRDEGVKMHGLNPHSFDQRHEALNLTILVDNSKDMAQYQEDLSWVLKPVWKRMNRRDRIRVIHFAGNVRHRSPYDWSVRRAQREVARWQKSEGKRIDKALYGAITQMAPLRRRKAVLLLTAGRCGPDSFLQYGQESLSHYARVHDVPVYVIHFSAGNCASLAHESGGKAIKAYNSRALTELINKLHKRRRRYHVLSYKTFRNSALSGKVRRIDLKISYGGQLGIARAHYVNPKGE
jgi:hypothetical protein